MIFVVLLSSYSSILRALKYMCNQWRIGFREGEERERERARGLAESQDRKTFTINKIQSDHSQLFYFKLLFDIKMFK